MPNHPKKHHFVPQFLLRRFADQAERLIVHRVMAQKQYQASVTNVGHRNFGHTLYRPGRAPDHTTLEAAMSQIEGDAMSAIRTLDAARSRTVPSEAREALAWLLALQWQRSRFLMYVVAREVDAESQTQQAPREEMQTSLLGLLDSYVISPWTMRHEDVRPKDQFNYLVSVLAGMHWSCYRPRTGGLLVGDNIVCFSGYAGSDPPSLPPGVYDHGVGAGIHEFRRITVPLGESMALIICRDPDEARRLDTALLNRFTVFNSREFVAHSPGWAADHPRLAHDLSTWLDIQHMIAPAFLQEYGISGVM